MYKEFYRFTESPFNITADPDFFFPGSRQSDALSNLMFGINARKGILSVTGEIGTGKTTLIRTLLSRLDDTIKTALVLNPNFSDLQLLQIIIKDLGLVGDYKDKFEIVAALNEYLLAETNRGNNVVVIIDEAQNLSVEQLENVRLLSNIETEKEKLLQIILVGQPELHHKLRLRELRQLNQRITVRYHMQPLEKEELKDYINHRLKVASLKNRAIVRFEEDALDEIYRHTQGTPRMINILCDRALLAGFVKEAFKLDREIIKQCAKEVFECEYH